MKFFGNLMIELVDILKQLKRPNGNSITAFKEVYMSVMYCEHCDQYIDTDYNAEHFDEDGNCELEKEDSEEGE
jgi:hypothetical protein